jgi:hypothetical protein
MAYFNLTNIFEVKSIKHLVIYKLLFLYKNITMFMIRNPKILMQFVNI